MLPAWIIEEIRREEAQEVALELELPLEMPYWYKEPDAEVEKDRGVVEITW